MNVNIICSPCLLCAKNFENIFINQLILKLSRKWDFFQDTEVMDPVEALNRIEANLSLKYSSTPDFNNIGIQNHSFHPTYAVKSDPAQPNTATLLKPGNGWAQLKQEYGVEPCPDGTEESILPNCSPEEEENDEGTLLVLAESITEDETGVKYIKTELELSAVSFERKEREERGCRCEDFIWDNQEYKISGSLEFIMLKNYRGHGLEWRPFLTLYVPFGPPIYEFEVGRAGHLFYFRAFSNRNEAQNDRYNI